jgi:hypothetical protein
MINSPAILHVSLFVDSHKHLRRGSLFISVGLYSPCGPWPFSQFLNLYTVGRTPWTGDQSNARPLPTHRTTQKHNTPTRIFTHLVRFEPTIPVFERAKAVHALDDASTVIGGGALCQDFICPFNTPISIHAFGSIFIPAVLICDHFYFVSLAVVLFCLASLRPSLLLSLREIVIFSYLTSR